MGDLGDWQAVHAYACSLPGTESASYYGGPAVKLVVNGRPLVSPSREEGSFCLHIDQDHKAMLIDLDSSRFWETPHYVGYPALLVRYGPGAGVTEWIECARELASQRKPARGR